MEKEIEFLKDHIYELYKYTKSKKDLTYDMNVELLFRICKAFSYYEYQLKKQKEIINNAINFINTPWSFESGNEKVDEIIHQKKIELIKLLKDKEV